MELSELKQKAEAIRTRRKSGRRGHWPKSFKEEVKACCQSGTPISSIAEATGIPHQTIRAWITAQRRQPDRRGFQEVTVTEVAQPSPITVTWKDAMEISGLSFEHLRQLLREGLL